MKALAAIILLLLSGCVAISPSEPIPLPPPMIGATDMPASGLRK